MGFVHQEWSGLTFPLVATSCYAILYAARIVPLDCSATLQTASRVWATGLGIFTLTIVGIIDAFYFLLGMPQWVFCTGLPQVPAPPPLSASAVERTGEKAYCQCWPPFGGKLSEVEEAASAEAASRSFFHRHNSMCGIHVAKDALPEGKLAVVVDVVVDVGANETPSQIELKIERVMSGHIT